MSVPKTIFWSLSWVPVAITFSQVYGQFISVSGRSMQPSLNPDSNLGSRDWVWVQKYGRDKLNNGDVVVLRSPSNPERVLIKRIVGCDGDIVKPRLNSYPKESVKIPQNHLWVEGDFIHSQDSNDFGPISSGLVLGHATYIVWPPYRWGKIPQSTTNSNERVSK